jgi:hypothetical protein
VCRVKAADPEMPGLEVLPNSGTSIAFDLWRFFAFAPIFDHVLAAETTDLPLI